MTEMNQKILMTSRIMQLMSSQEKKFISLEKKT